MWAASLAALDRFSDPFHLTMLVVGVLAGTVIGILPGMGGIASVAILLPFVYKLDPHAAMALLVGSVAVVHTSDTITSVLIGAPGSSAAATTVLDGHALAKQGQAARALSAAFLSSMLGGLIGAIFLTISLPIARPLVLSFGSPELLMLCILGLCFAAFLTGGAPLKGAIAGALGLLVGTIGAAPAESVYRYTFDQLYLSDGIPLVVVALGIFGVAEIIDLLAKGGTIAERIELGHGWIEGMKDVFRHWGILIRGSLIGVWAGILPGIGATAGTWMSYGHVVALARDKEKFGKGDIRGVIAPESANNSVEAGDLIPTLLFSVPGGAPAAILMGALIVFGIQPGPRMIQEHMDLIFTIIWSFALANILGAGLCLLLSPVLAKFTAIPFVTLAPAILVTMFLGAYQNTQHLGDLLGLLLLGLLGWFMKQLGWPRPPLLIGFVLAPPTEQYLWISISRYNFDWLVRPGVIILGLILLASIIWGMYSGNKSGKAIGDEGGEETAVWGKIPSTLFTALMLLILIMAFIGATEFPFLAAIFPLAATIPGIPLAAIQLFFDLRTPAPKGETVGKMRAKRALPYFLAIVLFYGTLWLVGFRVATAVFALLFLRSFSAMRWHQALFYTVICLATIELLGWLLNLYWPEALFLSW